MCQKGVESSVSLDSAGWRKAYSSFARSTPYCVPLFLLRIGSDRYLVIAHGHMSLCHCPARSGSCANWKDVSTFTPQPCSLAFYSMFRNEHYHESGHFHYLGDSGPSNTAKPAAFLWRGPIIMRCDSWFVHTYHRGDLLTERWLRSSSTRRREYWACLQSPLRCWHAFPECSGNP